MGINIDDLKEHLPYYLTQDQQDGLVKALKDFPEKANYFTLLHADQILQGDGWGGLYIMSFPSGNGKLVKGILLSNSCDIAPENKRNTPPLVTFAPLISLAKYIDLLVKNGLDKDRINAAVDSIRLQRTTSIFYLPKGGDLKEEHIALLSDLHTVPVQAFVDEPSREKLFTLSLLGFYMFLMKLSIHFCRFHEKVDRPSA